MNINDINEILKLTAEVYGEDSCAFAVVCDKFLGDDTLIKEKFKDSKQVNMPPAESIILSITEDQQE